MSITDHIDRLVKARWNPGETFSIYDMYSIARQEGITTSDSTVQRTMQELRDRETISFYADGIKGHYTRLPTGLEHADNPTSIMKQAANTVAGNRRESERRMVADRVLRLLSTGEPDTNLVEDI